MKEKLVGILEDIRPEIDYEHETNYVSEGLFDSLDIVSILDSICEEFDLDIGPDELVKDNFETIDSMLSMINRYIRQ